MKKYHFENNFFYPRSLPQVVGNLEIPGNQPQIVREVDEWK
jgi:hypothetical protein